jgi:hypothetical protein
MLSRSQVLNMLVGLKEVGDLELVDQDVILSKATAPSAFPLVRSMAAIIRQLFDAFDYEQSPEFENKSVNKSPEVQQMLRRLLTPENRKAARLRLAEALSSVLDSNAAFDLVSLDKHALLLELRMLAGQLPNS